MTDNGTRTDAQSYPSRDDQNDWDRPQEKPLGLTLGIAAFVIASLLLCAVYFWFASAAR
ncbi:hypothetical protein ACLBXM_07200 [Xanthobacteraceae bacterium A53D]